MEFPMMGANANNPHIPKIILGMPANKSIIILNDFCNLNGANFLMKTTIPKLVGMAIIRAKKEEVNVPIMHPNAPNSEVTGFQSRVRIKFSPKRWIVGRLLKNKVIKIPKNDMENKNTTVKHI
jgi:hypothetical protein